MKTSTPWLLLPLLALLPLRAWAGPVEAARLLDEARKTKARPWPTRIEAYRRVLREARPTDRSYARALTSMAAVLEQEGLVHGAMAWRARAAALGPARNEGRLGRVLTLGLALRREGDAVAAERALEEVLRLGEAVAAPKAERALVALAEDARAAKDRPRIEALALTARHGRFTPTARLRVLDCLGLVRFDAGALAGAQAALGEAKRIWRNALEHGEEKEARRVAKRWLDLGVRKRLADVDAD